MFCPNCGNENSSEQRFCRLCGLRLEVISQAIQQELQASNIPVVRTSSLNIRSLLMTAWHYGFFLLLLGGIIISIGKKVVGEQLIADIGTIMSLIGLAFLVGRGMLLLNAQGFHPARNVPKAETTTKLNPLLEAKEAPPSVTEFTTRHFDPVYAERKDPETPGNRSRSDS
jgi:hypothetical protein